jgi:COP9 signalosome complex subunit 2
MDPAQALALQVYDATLQIFHPQQGACPNERLWFKTNIKFGQLLYETQQTSKLQAVLKELQAVHQKTAVDNERNGSSSSSSSSSSTNSMEIYALQIQLHSQTRDHKRLRATYQQAMQVRGGIPHPRTLALIQELGGKMQLAAKEYDAACQTFFQAFKSYDEAGDLSRLRCLNYLVLAGMLGRSNINPFDSQECRPYKDDPSVVAMTNLVAAFHDNDIVAFENILKQPKGQRLLADTFLRNHVADLLETIRRQVLHRLVQPYSRISLQALADALNHMAVADLEALLVRLIVDGTLANARIDRTQGILVRVVADASDAESEEMEILVHLVGLVDQASQQVSNVRIKESSTMSMMSIGGGTSAAVGSGMAAFRGMVQS